MLQFPWAQESGQTRKQSFRLIGLTNEHHI